MSYAIISDCLAYAHKYLFDEIATHKHKKLEIRQEDTAKQPHSNTIFPECSQFHQVFQFIEDNYHKPIDIADVAQAVGYSPAYLTNLVKRRTQRTVLGWIVERRMSEARYLLLDTERSVNQIATAVGYADAGYFSRRFRQLHKLSPQMWRNGHRTRAASASECKDYTISLTGV
jgi:AraC-like DNA-binding protein